MCHTGDSLFWFIFSVGIGSGGGRERPVIGVTVGLFTSMSALIVVEGRIVSFLGVWRIGNMGMEVWYCHQ